MPAPFAGVPFQPSPAADTTLPGSDRRAFRP